MSRFEYTIEHTSLDMEYGYVLTFNPYTGKYAYMNNGTLKYYFGTGSESDDNETRSKVGYGETPELAIQDLKNKQL